MKRKCAFCLAGLPARCVCQAQAADEIIEQISQRARNELVPKVWRDLPAKTADTEPLLRSCQICSHPQASPVRGLDGGNVWLCHTCQSRRAWSLNNLDVRARESA